MWEVDAFVPAAMRDKGSIEGRPMSRTQIDVDAMISRRQTDPVHAHRTASAGPNAAVTIPPRPSSSAPTMPTSMPATLYRTPMALRWSTPC